MKRLLTHITAFALLAFPLVVSAANCPDAPSGGLVNPSNYCTLDELLAGILHAVVLIAFPIVVLMFVYLGAQFVFNGNNPGELEKIRKNFVWAIVGALLVLGAEALSRAISATVHALGG